MPWPRCLHRQSLPLKTVNPTSFDYFLNTIMHLVTLISFACTVISASAFQFPEFVPLHRRQEAGTPAYECHANCGMLHII
jgi:hypothetical protein